MDIKALIKVALGKAVTKEQLDALKADIVKLETQLAPATAQLKEMKTKDGKMLTVEGDLKEGVMIMEISATGPAPAPDADYQLEDGTIVSVSGGTIKAIKPVAAPATPPPAEMVQQMEAKFSAHKKELEDSYAVKLAAQEVKFKSDLDELRKVFLAQHKIVEAMLNAEVDTTVKKNPKKYEDMSAAEKYHHDNPIS